VKTEIDDMPQLPLDRAKVWATTYAEIVTR